MKNKYIEKGFSYLLEINNFLMLMIQKLNESKVKKNFFLYLFFFSSGYIFINFKIYILYFNVVYVFFIVK